MTADDLQRWIATFAVKAPEPEPVVIDGYGPPLLDDELLRAVLLMQRGCRRCRCLVCLCGLL